MPPRPLALLALLLALLAPSAFAERLIQSHSLNPCMSNSSLSATLFNVVFTPGNRSLAFNIVGVSDIAGNVTAEIDIYAYGYRILQRTLDPCANGDLRQLCPMNTGQINIRSNLDLDADVISSVPGIAYTVPDLDGRVRIYIKDANTGTSRACVEADLSNGKTVYQHAVGWTTAVIVVAALIASAVASSLGHSNTAAHVAAYTMSLFSYFQTQAYVGMTAVDLPPIVDSWTQNFQWSMGIARLQAFQDLATWYQRSTGGTPSTILSTLGEASVQVQKRMVKRAVELVQNLAKRAEQDAENNSVKVRGIERVGFRAGIEPTNIFLTGYIFFVLFTLVVIACVCIFKMIVAGLERAGKLRNNKLREFREKWRAVLGGIIIRVGLITFPQIVVLCCWELTVRDSAAEVVLAIITLLATLAILGRSCHRVVQRARISIREHKTPAYLLFSDHDFLTRWGALYVQFKTACYYFMIPGLTYIFVKGLFVAFSQGSGTTQAFAMIILDAAYLIILCIRRPFFDKKTNVVNIFLAVVNFVGSILLLIFTQIFGQPGIVTGVAGVVYFIFSAASALILLIVVLSASYLAIVSKNPDKRYQPVQDDRGSFMKSRDRFGGEELDHLGMVARNEHPYSPSDQSLVEPAKSILHGDRESK